MKTAGPDACADANADANADADADPRLRPPPVDTRHTPDTHQTHIHARVRAIGMLLT